MTTKSMVDEFAAGIVFRTSIYLTACLGILLTIAILFRRFDLPDTAQLSLAQEGLFLLPTLAFNYVAIWSAGYLATLSTKKRLLRSNLPGDGRKTPSAEDRKAIASATGAADLIANPRGPTDPERQYAASIQSPLVGNKVARQTPESAAEIPQSEQALIAEASHF